MTIPLVDMVSGTKEARAQELVEYTALLKRHEAPSAALGEQQDSAPAPEALHLRQVILQDMAGSLSSSSAGRADCDTLALPDLGSFRLRARTVSVAGALSSPSPSLQGAGRSSGSSRPHSELLQGVVGFGSALTAPSPLLLSAAPPSSLLRELEQVQVEAAVGVPGTIAEGSGGGESAADAVVEPAPLQKPMHQPAAPPRRRLLVAVTDPVNVGRLITLANLFPPSEAALDMLWLQGNSEAPSAYMQTIENVRDPHMRAALDDCAGRSSGAGTLEFYTFPSGNPWLDAQVRAARLGCDIFLCSHKLMMLSQGIVNVLASLSTAEWGNLLGLHGGDAAEASAAAVAADRRPGLRAATRAAHGGALRATMAIFFDHGCPSRITRALSWGGQGVAEFLSLVPIADLSVREVERPRADEGAMGFERVWPREEEEGVYPLALLSGDSQGEESEDELVQRLECSISICAAKRTSALVVFKKFSGQGEGSGSEAAVPPPPSATPAAEVHAEA